MKDKRELREEIIFKREQMNIQEKNKKDDLIHEKLFQDEVFMNSNQVFIYLNYKNEIDTYKIIRRSFELNKKVGIPKTIFKDRQMDFVYLRDFDDIERIPLNKMGIKEPIEGDVLMPTDNTIVIVPGVAFTLNGERLGYGGGFYDRYLSKYNIKNKIVLCYEYQILNSIPTDEKDVLVSKIITEDRVIEIK